MSKNKQKLELTWIGKDREVNLEPRILVEVPEKSYGDKNTENMLIHGDNLLALKALEQDFAGKIKCIYIDPPYNTGNAFNVYDDNVEHSKWLSLMKQRLEMLKILLRQDGVIFIQINDDEAAYLKVLCDEVFGRNNYETTFFVKVRHENRILREDSKYQLCIEQVHCYRASDKYISARREKTRNSEADYQYDIEICGEYAEKTVINGYTVEIYKPDSYKIIKSGEEKGSLKQYQIRGSLITQKGSASEYYELNLRQRRSIDGLGALYKVIGMGVSGDGLGYRYIMQPLKQESKNGFYFQGKPIKKKIDKGLPYPNFYDKTIEFNNAGYEGYGYFNGGKKPEAWINFLLSLADLKSNEFVLDSFLGSGTTAAVAHKMGVNYIGIELGDHCYTHCKPRLDMVIDGNDENGISKAVNWQGGGGYKFYELAPSLLKKDEFDNWIIEPKYDAEMLAEAMAKHEGYKFSPDEINVYKQGKSTEKDFIFTTTQFISLDLLNKIASQINEDESLLICATHFEEGIYNKFSNITIKKIPQILLDRCEFGKLEYNLNIVEEAQPEDFEDDEALEDEE